MTAPEGEKPAVPLAEAMRAAGRELTGPAHAHLDAPCDETCYEPAPVAPPAPDIRGYLAEFRRKFATHVPAVIPPAEEEVDEVWAALHAHQGRLDALDATLEAQEAARVLERRLDTAMAHAVALVIPLAERRGLDGDEIRAEVLKTAAQIFHGLGGVG